MKYNETEIEFCNFFKQFLISKFKAKQINVIFVFYNILIIDVHPLLQ